MYPEAMGLVGTLIWLSGGFLVGCLVSTEKGKQDTGSLLGREQEDESIR